MKVIVYSLFAVGLAAAPVAHAQTYDWTGASGFLWGAGNNWNPATSPNSGTADARVLINTGLVPDTGSTDGYGLRLNVDATVNSLHSNLWRFALIAAQSKTLRFSDGGSLSFGTAFTATTSSFGSTSSAHRVRIAAIGDLSLRNDGTGTAHSGYGYFYNDASATKDSTFTFSGIGNWLFNNNSYLGRQKASLSVPEGPTVDVTHGVSVRLANDFSGTFTYGGTLAADLKNLQVSGGTFIINSARTVSVSGNAIVDSGGRLGGVGTLSGNLLVHGRLFTSTAATAGTLNVNGDLTLAASSSTTLRLLANGTADRINGTGILALGGELVISGAAPADEISGVSLYSGFSGVTGDWDSINLFGTSLSSAGGGVWRGVIGEYQYELNAATGMLSSGQVPEPAAVAALLGAVVAGVVIARRRRRTA